MTAINRRKLMVGAAVGAAGAVVSLVPLIAPEEDVYERIRRMTSTQSGPAVMVFCGPAQGRSPLLGEQLAPASSGLFLLGTKGSALYATVTVGITRSVGMGCCCH